VKSILYGFYTRRLAAVMLSRVLMLYIAGLLFFAFLISVEAMLGGTAGAGAAAATAAATEKIKQLVLPGMPMNAAAYVTWRFTTVVLTLAASEDPAGTMTYFTDMDAIPSPTDAQLTLDPTSPLIRLDTSMFSAVLAAAAQAGMEGQAVIGTVMAGGMVVLGTGRVALRAADKHFSYKAVVMADMATQKLLALKCQNIQGAASYIAEFKLCKQLMGQGVNALSQSLGTQLLRKHLEAISQFAAVFALVDTLDTSPTLDQLLDRLGKVENEWRQRNQQQTGGTAFLASQGGGGGPGGGGPGGGPGGKGKKPKSKAKGGGKGGQTQPGQKTDREKESTCDYCGGKGHYARNCNKKAADVKSGKIPAGSGRTQKPPGGQQQQQPSGQQQQPSTGQQPPPAGGWWPWNSQQKGKGQPKGGGKGGGGKGF
jgi:hypothetical protein